MKVSKVETLVVNAGIRNWIFVKVETTESVLYGWGESTTGSKTKSVVAAIEDISRLIIGHEPLARRMNVTHLRRMFMLL